MIHYETEREKRSGRMAASKRGEEESRERHSFYYGAFVKQSNMSHDRNEPIKY